MDHDADVIIVGTGNAAFCAAHAAAESGAHVLMLDKAPADALGGNTYFTAGAIRTTHQGTEELAELIDEADDRLPATDIDPYGPEDFAADMRRLTRDECDPALTRAMAEDISATIRWMRGHGIRFRLQYERQSHHVRGRYRFFGNLPLATVDGGKGMVAQHLGAARRAGVTIRHNTEVDRILQDGDGHVTGVASRGTEFRAPAVVLASGGFQASELLRTQYLGPQWGRAKVRGTPHNTGQALLAALARGAASAGSWSSCHSVAWDAGAPDSGDFELTNRHTKQSYPYGLVVNADGHRFLDEGADLRNYTYAKYGAEILRQPGALAWQLFDARTAPLLGSAEYEAPGVSRIEADSLSDLAKQAGIDPEGLERTIADYNAATRPGTFDPSLKDDLATTGLEPPKSNWAQPLDQPPYLAFAVTCGITFTFGGLHIDTAARVLDTDRTPIPGLFAAGETVGGLFAHNYPGGSGLAAGAVFGRRAGAGAAAHPRSGR